MAKPQTHDGKLICCLCGNYINDQFGHNAAPLVEGGRCCSTCNDIVILPCRMNPKVLEQAQKFICSELFK